MIGHRRQWLASAILLVVFAAPAFAGEAQGLTLAQLIAIARSDNKDLQVARYAIAIGRARLQQAGLRSNPRLDLSARSDALFGNEGEHGGAIGISQDFPVAGRLLREKDVARVDIALAEAEVADAERRLAGDVAAQVFRIVLAGQRLRSLDELVDAEHALARTTRERFKAAEVSELDVNTVQLELQRLTLEQAARASERQSAELALNTLLGREATAPIAIAEPLPSDDSLFDLPQLQDRALALRPDLRAAMLEVDRAGAERALAHAQRWQDWSVGVELSQDKQVITGAPPQGNDRAIGLSLSIPLPLTNKGQGQIVEAEAHRDQALARVDALRLVIRSDVAGAHAEIARLQDALAQYGRATQPLVERNLRLAQQGYREGLIPIFDVMQAQRQQAEWAANRLDLRDRYVQAIVRLHTAVGDYLKD